MYGVREVVAWMAKFGLSAQMAVTAYRAFGPATVEALKKNPYMLCGEPLNLKFSQVDGIAAQLQVGQGSDLRIAAGLLYALRRNEIYLPARSAQRRAGYCCAAGGACHIPDRKPQNAGKRYPRFGIDPRF